MSELAGRRVLVTGGAGFIGSHLTRRLVGMGAEVAVTTKYHSLMDNVRLVDVWDRIRVIEADLRNLDSLAAVRAFRPQVVYHLAAYNHVGDSFTHVQEALDSNMKGSANLLQSLEDYDRFIYVATSEVYGCQTGFPFTETMTPNPISPYSIGKYGGEQYARMLMEQQKRPIVILRPFNAFGPYQSQRAVIPEIITDCLRDRPIHATEGRQTREFNFVENLVDGFILAGEQPAALGQTINLGSGQEIAIRDLIRMIHSRTGSRSELRFGSLPYRPTEIWRMAADNRRARELLGWEPRVAFEDGLEITIGWVRAFIGEFTAPGSGLHRLAAWRGPD
ncbi:MAG: GDP-mannose 4,6-dehydratase [Magnetococcales bacterium]|nr:GDP-mannose 4,6-dehydratase [Magnetococcales bacterium]